MAGCQQQSQSTGLNTSGEGKKDQVEINPPVCETNDEEPGRGRAAGLRLELKTLAGKLEELSIIANGTVRLEMSLSAMSGKVVLTWGSDSDLDQLLRRKDLLDGILSGTQWKISKILPEAQNRAKEDGKCGNSSLESAGEQSASYTSDLKLEDLEKILKDLRTEANGAVRMKMPLSAKHDFKNYEEVLIWDDDFEDSDPKQQKSENHGSFSGTKWKISTQINLPEDPNGAEGVGEPGHDPTQSAKGKQSKGKGKA